MYPLNLYSLPPLVSSILFLLLGVYVFLNNRRSAVNITFFGVCLVTFWWQFSWFILFNITDQMLASVLVRVGYVGIIFIPVFFYHFFVEFLGGNDKIDKYLIKFAYIVGVVFEFFLLATPFLISGYYDFFWGYYPKAGILHPVFLFFLTILSVRGAYLLAFHKKNVCTTSLCNEQRKYLLAGFILYFLAACDFLVNYGLEFYPFGFVFILFSLVITAEAITKYQLFEVKVFLTELLVTSIAVILFVQAVFEVGVLEKSFGLLFLLLFMVFGYYLIKVTHEESKRRMEAESVAYEERLLRENAERLAADLKRLDLAKTQFMISTQHHLRSPLTVIQGYLSMIEEGTYGKVNKKVAAKIHASLGEAQKLIKVVNDLLDMAKYQMNVNTAERQSSDIVSILRDVVLDLAETAAKKDLKLEYADRKDFPPVAINARGVREAVYNIVDNAIKYTKQGGVTVRAELTGSNVLVSITDTGIGMEEIDRLGLFKKTFERGEQAREINTTGKGIGLYLAGQMILNSGGNIWVMSKGKGYGTTFYIELPIAGTASVANPPINGKKAGIDK